MQTPLATVRQSTAAPAAKRADRRERYSPRRDSRARSRSRWAHRRSQTAPGHRPRSPNRATPPNASWVVAQLRSRCDRYATAVAQSTYPQARRHQGRPGRAIHGHGRRSTRCPGAPPTLRPAGSRPVVIDRLHAQRRLQAGHIPNATQRLGIVPVERLHEAAPGTEVYRALQPTGKVDLLIVVEIRKPGRRGLQSRTIGRRGQFRGIPGVGNAIRCNPAIRPI